MEEKIDDYILSHSDCEPDVLKKINRNAHLHLINPRMISGHLQGRILKMICRMVRPSSVLELGTFTGYSALCLAEGMPQNGMLHTIEHNDELEDVIRENLALSPYGEKIKLHIGEALEIIPSLDETFDLVFIDADKRQYLDYYHAVFPKTRTGGFILADNTLWAGKVTKTLHNNDTQTKAILEFNDFIANDTRIEKVILPLRDGLTLLMKK